MTDSEARRFMKMEIERQVRIILSGSAGDNNQFSETIENLYPGSPGIPARPVMHPYGIVSRAPRGTLQVTARQGEHSGNRLILGHRDANRPALEEGETAVYNVAGYQVRLNKASVTIGKGGVFETMVVGETLAQLLGDLIELLAMHTHSNGNEGAPTGAPLEAADFTQLKTQNIDNGKILAKDGGRF